jgi:hypothetical protein
VSERDREASRVRSPWPTMGYHAMKKNLSFFTVHNSFVFVNPNSCVSVMQNYMCSCDFFCHDQYYYMSSPLQSKYFEKDGKESDY